MGEAKRRKNLDPDYGKPNHTKLMREFAQFFIDNPIGLVWSSMLVDNLSEKLGLQLRQELASLPDSSKSLEILDRLQQRPTDALFAMCKAATLLIIKQNFDIRKYNLRVDDEVSLVLNNVYDTLYQMLIALPKYMLAGQYPPSEQDFLLLVEELSY